MLLPGPTSVSKHFVTFLKRAVLKRRQDYTGSRLGLIRSYHQPEVVVHGLEEKLIVGPIEDVFEVGQRDFVGRDRQLDQIRRVLVIDMIDHFGLFHIRGDRRAAASDRFTTARQERENDTQHRYHRPEPWPCSFRADIGQLQRQRSRQFPSSTVARPAKRDSPDHTPGRHRRDVIIVVPGEPRAHTRTHKHAHTRIYTHAHRPTRARTRSCAHAHTAHK